MPLINFKTNLTSLKYGLDEPGGGSSGQPFLQFPIPGPDTNRRILDYYVANQSGLDFPIRGGAITEAQNGTYTTNAAIFDSVLIGKFLKSAPYGKAFVDKQKGLQLTNPLTQVPSTSGGLVNIGRVLQGLGVGKAGTAAAGIVTQAYNPDNTLAQVVAMGTGTHYNRQGTHPTISENIYQTYQGIVGDPSNNTEVTNRLAILRTLKLIGNTNFLITSNSIFQTGIDPDLVDRLGISILQNQLFNYQGGPGSVYGIGSTIINRAQNPDGSYVTTDAANTFITDGFTVGGYNTAYSAIGFTYEQIASQGTRVNSPGSPTLAAIQDFRKQTNLKDPIIPYSVTDYAKTNIANPGSQGGLGVGNPGGPLQPYSTYTSSKADGYDRLNYKNLFYFNPNQATPWTAGGSNTNDIIKFSFECLSNDNQDQAIALVFRAFLEGQISDSNTGQYNSFKYLGRGETFRTYQGFDRSISFSFKLFAQSRVEMRPLYKKLNNLISQVYPDYSPTSNLMRGNVVNLTIGDYIYRMPGFLENVNVTIDNGNTPWDIVLGGANETDMAQLPHMVTVQCSFKPIMNILPRRETKDNPNVPLIVNSAKDRSIENTFTYKTSIGLGKTGTVKVGELDQGEFPPFDMSQVPKGNRLNLITLPGPTN